MRTIVSRVGAEAAASGLVGVVAAGASGLVGVAAGVVTARTLPTAASVR